MNELPKFEVNVKLYRGGEPHTHDLLGFADLVIGGAFVIKGIRILMGRPRDGYIAAPYLSFPSKKGVGAAAEKWFEIAHPITVEAREAITAAVLRAYAKAAAKT